MPGTRVADAGDMRWLAFVTPVVLLSAACSAELSQNGTTSSPSNDDAGIDSATNVPADHRAQSVTCAPTPVGNEPTIFDAGLPEGTRFDCRTNEDCTAHAGGRCIFTSMQEADAPNPDLGTRCFYDECAVDTDCPANSVCQCGSGGAAANTCSPVGDCRTDSDCVGGYCSPSKDYCATFNGYFCHSASDQCNTDQDCENSGEGLGAKCIVDTKSGQWSCEQIGCASAGTP